MIPGESPVNCVFRCVQEMVDYNLNPPRSFHAVFSELKEALPFARLQHQGERSDLAYFLPDPGAVGEIG